ncbi:MAG: hypothetical protein C4540_03790, partial [Candidatus Omnitrophota bacterium]
MNKVGLEPTKIAEMQGGKGEISPSSFHIGSNNTQQPSEQNIPHQEYRSSFKAWIRVVAFIILAVFLPEQAAQAAQYNWQAIWQQPAAYKPLLANSAYLDTPVAVKNILTEVAGKSLTAIQLSPNLTLQLNEPLEMSRERIEEIYQWLQGKPCGSKTLFDLLALEGVPALEQDVAVLALTVDILNNVVKPVGAPAVIKTSLFALSKTAQFFNIPMYAARIEDFNAYAQSFAPFIAHLKGDHYVFVTHIKDSKAYFIDEHKESFLPLEKFLKDFSGYALIPESHVAKSSIVLVPDEEARGILGAGNSRRDGIENNLGLLFGTFIAPAFPKISTSSFATLARNYAITYAMPKMMKGLGANQTWQNVGGAFLAGAAIGGLQANGKVFGWRSNSWTAALQTGSVWATSAAVQEYGYKQKWDTGKYGFGGASYLASKIAGTIVETGFSKALGGWQVENGKMVWKNKTGLQAKSGFNEKWRPLLGEGVSLYTQHILGNNGWESAFSRAGGSFAGNYLTGMEDKGLFTALSRYAFTGALSSGLQQLAKKYPSLGVGVGVDLAMSAGLFSAFSKLGDNAGSRAELFKETLNSNMRSAIGNFLSFGQARLDKKGNLEYSSYASMGASLGADIADFVRQAQNLPNASWTKKNWEDYLAGRKVDATSGWVATAGERFLSNMNTQTVRNIANVVFDRLEGYQWDKLNGYGRWDAHGDEWAKHNPAGEWYEQKFGIAAGDVVKGKIKIEKIYNIDGDLLGTPLLDVLGLRIGGDEAPSSSEMISFRHVPITLDGQVWQIIDSNSLTDKKQMPLTMEEAFKFLKHPRREEGNLYIADNELTGKKEMLYPASDSRTGQVGFTYSGKFAPTSGIVIDGNGNISWDASLAVDDRAPVPMLPSQEMLKLLQDSAYSTIPSTQIQTASVGLTSGDAIGGIAAGGTTNPVLFAWKTNLEGKEEYGFISQYSNLAAREAASRVNVEGYQVTNSDSFPAAIVGLRNNQPIIVYSQQGKIGFTNTGGLYTRFNNQVFRNLENKEGVADVAVGIDSRQWAEDNNLIHVAVTSSPAHRGAINSLFIGSSSGGSSSAATIFASDEKWGLAGEINPAIGGWTVTASRYFPSQLSWSAIIDVAKKESVALAPNLQHARLVAGAQGSPLPWAPDVYMPKDIAIAISPSGSVFEVYNNAQPTIGLRQKSAIDFVAPTSSFDQLVVHLMTNKAKENDAYTLAALGDRWHALSLAQMDSQNRYQPDYTQDFLSRAININKSSVISRGPAGDDTLNVDLISVAAGSSHTIGFRFKSEDGKLVLHSEPLINAGGNVYATDRVRAAQESGSRVWIEYKDGTYAITTPGSIGGVVGLPFQLTSSGWQGGLPLGEGTRFWGAKDSEVTIGTYAWKNLPGFVVKDGTFNTDLGQDGLISISASPVLAKLKIALNIKDGSYDDNGLALSLKGIKADSAAWEGKVGDVWTGGRGIASGDYEYQYTNPAFLSEQLVRSGVITAIQALHTETDAKKLPAVSTLALVGEGGIISRPLALGTSTEGGSLPLSFADITHDKTLILGATEKPEDVIVIGSNAKTPFVINTKGTGIDAAISNSLLYSEGAQWHGVGQIENQNTVDLAITPSALGRNIQESKALAYQFGEDQNGHTLLNLLGALNPASPIVFAARNEVANAGMLGMTYLKQPYAYSQEIDKSHGAGQLLITYDRYAIYQKQQKQGETFQWQVAPGTYQFGESLQNNLGLKVYAQVNNGAVSEHPVTYQSTEAVLRITDSAGKVTEIPNYLHFGVKALPIAPEALLASQGTKTNTDDGLQTEMIFTADKIPSYYPIAQQKGIVTFDGRTNTIVTYGLNDSGSPYLSPMIQGVKWNIEKGFNVAETSPRVRESGIQVLENTVFGKGQFRITGKDVIATKGSSLASLIGLEKTTLSLKDNQQVRIDDGTQIYNLGRMLETGSLNSKYLEITKGLVDRGAIGLWTYKILGKDIAAARDMQSDLVNTSKLITGDTFNYEQGFAVLKFLLNDRASLDFTREKSAGSNGALAAVAADLRIASGANMENFGIADAPTRGYRYGLADAGQELVIGAGLKEKNGKLQFDSAVYGYDVGLQNVAFNMQGQPQIVRGPLGAPLSISRDPAALTSMEDISSDIFYRMTADKDVIGSAETMEGVRFGSLDNQYYMWQGKLAGGEFSGTGFELRPLSGNIRQETSGIAPNVAYAPQYEYTDAGGTKMRRTPTVSSNAKAYPREFTSWVEYNTPAGNHYFEKLPIAFTKDGLQYLGQIDGKRVHGWKILGDDAYYTPTYSSGLLPGHMERLQVASSPLMPDYTAIDKINGVFVPTGLTFSRKLTQAEQLHQLFNIKPEDAGKTRSINEASQVASIVLPLSEGNTQQSSDNSPIDLRRTTPTGKTDIRAGTQGTVQAFALGGSLVALDTPSVTFSRIHNEDGSTSVGDVDWQRTAPALDITMGAGSVYVPGGEGESRFTLVKTGNDDEAHQLFVYNPSTGRFNQAGKDLGAHIASTEFYVHKSGVWMKLGNNDQVVAISVPEKIEDMQTERYYQTDQGSLFVAAKKIDNDVISKALAVAITPQGVTAARDNLSLTEAISANSVENYLRELPTQSTIPILRHIINNDLQAAQREIILRDGTRTTLGKLVQDVGLKGISVEKMGDLIAGFKDGSLETDPAKRNLSDAFAAVYYIASLPSDDVIPYQKDIGGSLRITGNCAALGDNYLNTLSTLSPSVEPLLGVITSNTHLIPVIYLSEKYNQEKYADAPNISDKTALGYEFALRTMPFAVSLNKLKDNYGETFVPGLGGGDSLGIDTGAIANSWDAAVLRNLAIKKLSFGDRAGAVALLDTLGRGNAALSTGLTSGDVKIIPTSSGISIQFGGKTASYNLPKFTGPGEESLAIGWEDGKPIVGVQKNRFEWATAKYGRQVMTQDGLISGWITNARQLGNKDITFVEINSPDGRTHYGLVKDGSIIEYSKANDASMRQFIKEGLGSRAMLTTAAGDTVNLNDLSRTGLKFDIQQDDLNKFFQYIFPQREQGGLKKLLGNNHVSGAMEGAFIGATPGAVIAGLGSSGIITAPAAITIGGIVAIGGAVIGTIGGAIFGRDSIVKAAQWLGMDRAMEPTRSLADYYYNSRLGKSLNDKQGTIEGNTYNLLSSPGEGWWRSGANDIHAVLFVDGTGNLKVGFLDDTQAMALFSRNLESPAFQQYVALQTELDSKVDAEGAILAFESLPVVTGLTRSALKGGLNKLLTTEGRQLLKTELQAGIRRLPDKLLGRAGSAESLGSFFEKSLQGQGGIYANTKYTYKAGVQRIVDALPQVSRTAPAGARFATLKNMYYTVTNFANSFRTVAKVEGVAGTLRSVATKGGIVGRARVLLDASRPEFIRTVNAFGVRAEAALLNMAKEAGYTGFQAHPILGRLPVFSRHFGNWQFVKDASVKAFTSEISNAMLARYTLRSTLFHATKDVIAPGLGLGVLPAISLSYTLDQQLPSLKTLWQSFSGGVLFNQIVPAKGIAAESGTASLIDYGYTTLSRMAIRGGIPYATYLALDKWYGSDKSLTAIAKDIAIMGTLFSFGRGKSGLDAGKSSLVTELFRAKLGDWGLLNKIPVIRRIPVQAAVQGGFVGLRATNNWYKFNHEGQEWFNILGVDSSTALNFAHLFATLGAVKAWGGKTFYRYAVENGLSSIKNISARGIVESLNSGLKNFKSYYKNSYSPANILETGLSTSSSVAKILAIFQPVQYGGMVGFRYLVGPWLEKISNQSEDSWQLRSVAFGAKAASYVFGIKDLDGMPFSGKEGLKNLSRSLLSIPALYDTNGNPLKKFDTSTFLTNTFDSMAQGAVMGATFGYLLHVGRPIAEPVLHRIPLFSRAMKYLGEAGGDMIIGKEGTTLGRLARTRWFNIGRIHGFVGEEFFKEGIFADGLIGVVAGKWMNNSLESHGIAESAQEILTDFIGRRPGLLHAQLTRMLSNGGEIISISAPYSAWSAQSAGAVQQGLEQLYRSRQNLTPDVAALLLRNEDGQQQPTLPEALEIKIRLGDGRIQVVEVGDSSKLIEAAKIQHNLVNLEQQGLSQNNLLEIVQTRGLTGFDAKAEAAKQILLSSAYVTQDQLTSLALGQRIDIVGRSFDPLKINFDQALILQLSNSPALQQSLANAMNRNVLMADSGLRSSLLRRQEHADYELARYKQLSPYMLLAGVSVIDTPNFFSNSLFGSLYNAAFESKYESIINQGLADNGIARGSMFSRIPYLGAEWKITRDLRRSLLPDQIIERETERRIKEVNAKVEELQTKVAAIRARIDVLRSGFAVLSDKQKSIARSELKRLNEASRSIQETIAQKEAGLAVADRNAIRATVERELSYLKGQQRLASALKAFWSATPKSGTGLDGKEAKASLLGTKLKALATEWSNRKGITSDILGNLIWEASEHQRVGRTVQESGVFSSPTPYLKVGSENILIPEYSRLQSAFETTPDNLHIGSLYGASSLDLQSAMHQLGRALDEPILKYKLQFAGNNVDANSELSNFRAGVLSSILSTYQDQLLESAMAYGGASSPLSLAGFGSSKNPFKTSYHYLSSLSSALVPIEEEIIQDNALSLKNLYVYRDQQRVELEKALQDPNHRLFKSKIGTVADLQKILSNLTVDKIVTSGLIKVTPEMKGLLKVLSAGRDFAPRDIQEIDQMDSRAIIELLKQVLNQVPREQIVRAMFRQAIEDINNNRIDFSIQKTRGDSAKVGGSNGYFTMQMPYSRILEPIRDANNNIILGAGINSWGGYEFEHETMGHLLDYKLGVPFADSGDKLVDLGEILANARDTRSGILAPSTTRLKIIAAATGVNYLYGQKLEFTHGKERANIISRTAKDLALIDRDLVLPRLRWALTHPFTPFRKLDLTGRIQNTFAKNDGKLSVQVDAMLPASLTPPLYQSRGSSMFTDTLNKARQKNTLSFLGTITTEIARDHYDAIYNALRTNPNIEIRELGKKEFARKVKELGSVVEAAGYADEGMGQAGKVTIYVPKGIAKDPLSKLQVLGHEGIHALHDTAGQDIAVATLNSFLRGVEQVEDPMVQQVLVLNLGTLLDYYGRIYDNPLSDLTASFHKISNGEVQDELNSKLVRKDGRIKDQKTVVERLERIRQRIENNNYRYFDVEKGRVAVEAIGKLLSGYRSGSKVITIKDLEKLPPVVKSEHGLATEFIADLYDALNSIGAAGHNPLMQEVARQTLPNAPLVKVIAEHFDSLGYPQPIAFNEIRPSYLQASSWSDMSTVSASSPLSSSSPLSLKEAAGSRLARIFGVPLLLATLYFAAPYQSALTLDKTGLWDTQARRIYTSELDKATQAGDIEYTKLLSGRLADNYINEALNAAKEYRDFDGAVTAARPFIAEANTYLEKVGRPAVDSTLVLPSQTIKEVTSSIRTMEDLPMVIPMRQDQGYATSDEGWYSGVFRPLKNAVDAIYENYPAVSREQLSRYTFPKSMLPIQRQIFEEFGILVFANDGRSSREKGFIENKILPILTAIPKEHLAPVKFIVVTDKDGGKGVASEDERAIIIRGADFNLFHEIGHHVWWRVLGNNELERFNQLHSLIRSEGKGFVSPYSHQMEQYQAEQFSEIYRMYTTSTRELLEAANSKENYRSQALKEQISLVASLFAGNMGGGLSNIITIYKDGKPITVRTPETYYRGNQIPFEKLEEVVHSILPNHAAEQIKPVRVASASSPLGYSQPEILSKALEAFTGAQIVKAPEAMGVVAVPEEQIDIQKVKIEPMVTRGPPKMASSSPLSEDRYTGTISFVGEKLAQDFYRSSALERIIRFDSFLDQSLFNIHGIVVSPEDISKVSIKEDGKGSQKHVYLVDVALKDGRTFEFATKLAINKAKDFDFAKDNTAIPEEPIKLARLSGKADVSIPKFGLAVKAPEFSAYSEEYIRGETAAHKSVTLDRDTVRKITASWMKVNVFINNLLTNQQVGVENRFRMMTVKDMATHNIMIPVEATRMPVVVDIGESIPRKPVALITELYRHYPNFEGVFLGIKDILGETKGTEFLGVAYQDLRNKYLTQDNNKELWEMREVLRSFVPAEDATSSPIASSSPITLTPVIQQSLDRKLGAIVVGVSSPAKPEDSQETQESQKTQPLGGVGPVLPMTSVPAPGVSGTTGGSSSTGSGQAQTGAGSSNAGSGNTGIGSGAAILQIPTNLNILFDQYFIRALMSQIAQTGTGISHLTRGPTISMAAVASAAAGRGNRQERKEVSNIFASVLAVVILEPLYQERTSQTVSGRSNSQVASYEGRFVSMAAASSPVSEPENTVIFFDGHSQAGKTSFANALRDNKIPLDIPLETVLFINGDNFYSIYKDIREGRVVVAEQVTTSDPATALLLADMAYIREHKLPLSLYIGRFLTKLFAEYTDKKTVVWEASGIITDFEQALKLQPELNRMPWRIITLEIERTKAGTGSYKLSQQDLGRVPAVAVSSPVKSSNNNIKQLYGIITRNALISSSPAALGSAFGYVLAEEAAAGIHFERAPPAIATIAASPSVTNLPIYTVRTHTANYDNDRSVTQPQALIPSVPARRSASPWQVFRHAGVAGDLGIAAIVVYVGLAGAPNLQGLTPLARAHNTTRGGVAWLRSTMASLNSTTLLNSQKTTPYLQQRGKTVTATLGYSYSMKPQAISTPATAEQILGKSSLAQTAISSLAASPLQETTTSRST